MKITGAAVLSVGCLVATVAAGEVQAQVGGQLVKYRAYSTFGCAVSQSVATSFCLPSQWRFRQGYLSGAPDTWIEWGAWFPTLNCGWGSYSTLFSAPSIADCGNSWWQLPAFPNWQFAFRPDYLIRTTDGRDIPTQNDGDIYAPFDWELSQVQVSIYAEDHSQAPYPQHGFTYTANVTPEPATLTLLAGGLAGVGALVQRRRKARERRAG
jgi:hypothetical protein